MLSKASFKQSFTCTFKYIVLVICITSNVQKSLEETLATETQGRKTEKATIQVLEQEMVSTLDCHPQEMNTLCHTRLPKNKYLIDESNKYTTNRNFNSLINVSTGSLIAPFFIKWVDYFQQIDLKAQIADLQQQLDTERNKSKKLLEEFQKLETEDDEKYKRLKIINKENMKLKLSKVSKYLMILCVIKGFCPACLYCGLFQDKCSTSRD